MDAVMNFKIGRVTHFYDKIKVAIVELSGDLNVGDTIKFERGGESLFEQVVSSIQVEHQQLTEAKKGTTVGLKVEGEVREDSDVFKVVKS